MKRRLPLRALGAALLTSAVAAGAAHAAPTWLDEFAPYGDMRAIQLNSDAAMAPDGTVIFAHMAFTSAIEVRERPPGGPVGPAITLGPVGTIFQPFPNVQILTAKDGTAAVLFDLGSIRYASVRRPGATWSSPAEFMPSRAGRGQAALAPDGVLWAVSRTAPTDTSLSVFQLPRKPLIGLPKPDGATDSFPVLTAPRPGVVHIAYVEQRAGNEPDGDCFLQGAVRAVDLSAEYGVGSARTLDEFLATGTPGDSGCQLNHGDAFFPPMHLATDEAGADTAVHSATTFPDAKFRTQAHHRRAGRDWQDSEIVSPNAVFEGGAGTVAFVEADQHRSIAVRRPDGRWAPIELTTGDISTVRATSAGAGTNVVAWSEGVPSTTRARFISADAVAGPPVTLSEQNTGLAGLGSDRAGNAVALYTVQQPDQSLRLAARGFDAAPPRLTALETPARGRVGTPLSFSVAALDVWSPVTTSWNFGDGAFANGLDVQHAFGRAGAFTVRVSAADAVGNTATAARGVTIEPVRDIRPPLVTGLSAFPARPDQHDPVTIAFGTDEAGRARVDLEPDCRHCGRRRVSRTVGVGPARIDVGRLSEGTWRATVTVTDAAGNASRPQTLTLRVKR
jgi:hypothetical protein